MHVRKQDSNPFMTLLNTRQLQEMDVQHHLHPFTDTKILKENGSRIITKAEGVYLWDSDGNKIIDGMADELFGRNYYNKATHSFALEPRQLILCGRNLYLRTIVQPYHQ